jgi:2-oxoglutarate ferredoxin oxidoreductase subunit gamma
MTTTNIMLAGFGGQGLLFAGKMLAHAGMVEGKEISWLPSYGPEMRGGTCNCSVCISDELIGSPLIVNPDVLIAMNLPSYDKFIDTIVPGGVAIIDSTMVKTTSERDDITYIEIPATELATERGLKGLANVILVGKLVKETGCVAEASLDAALPACISARKAALLESNRQALELGRSL